MKKNMVLKIGVAFLCCIMLVTIGCPLNYAEGTVSPRYSYTRQVAAGLSIDSSGVAECQGRITVYDMSSEIVLNVRLQKKEGNVWVLVKKWSDSTVGDDELYINKTFTVTEGTYRVIASGIVTDASGDFETVSCTTSQRTYP